LKRRSLADFEAPIDTWRHLMKSCPDQDCQRWRDFRKFVQDVGPRPERRLMLVRHDVQKPFSPGNASWQPRHGPGIGRKAKLYHCAGKSMSLREWAQRLGITREALRQRIEKCQAFKVPLAQAFTTPACR
jgi:hypothetical protein